MFPCEMARYIAGFSREARKSGRFQWFYHPQRPACSIRTRCRLATAKNPKTIAGQDRRLRPGRLRSQHLGTFGGHFLAAAGGAGRGGGGAARGGGGAGRAIWGAGRGGGGAARGGGGAAIRGGGGAGLASCGAGRGGGGGGAARWGGS